MKKKLAFAMLLSALILAGCTGNAWNNNRSTAPSVSSKAAVSREESMIASEYESSIHEGSIPEEVPGAEKADPLHNLKHNEYEGLEITASVLEGKAILPGASIPVTVTVKNNGDKTIGYVQGSSAYETPQALHVEAEGLQPTLAKDHLGSATLDFVTKELKPGEELTFTTHIMAIEPNERWDEYTQGYHTDENGFIAEADWPALQERYSDLTAVKAGGYTAHVYFRYYVIAEGETNNPASEATGYAQADVPISVTE